MADPVQVRAHFCGYDAQSRVFLVRFAPSVVPHNGDVTSPPLRREVSDFQALDRAVAHANDQSSTPLARLSLRRLKKLTETAWIRDDLSTGWRLELQKNVIACEQWLSAALSTAPRDVHARFIDQAAYEAHAQARLALREKSQRAKQLQQYFTTESMLHLVLNRLWQVLRIPVDSEDLLWLEPSCGDGRIVDALVDAGAKRVVAYELDEAVWTKACGRVSTASIRRGDFLSSRPQTDEEAVTTVLALGNPPFGDETAESRDLVHRFIVHAAVAWRAQLIAFIVPIRCVKPGYLHEVTSTITKQDSSAIWDIAVAEPLEDCVFEFQETKRVKQPSALVVVVARSSAKRLLLEER